EVSGQMIFNNEVKLAGAPWIRDRSEFSDTFYEAEKLYEMVRKYGIETVRLDRYPSQRTFDYPFEAEFWMIEPQKRLIARLGADAALVARGSVNTDVTGEIVYIPPLEESEILDMIAQGPQEKYNGKIALMWTHASGNTAAALNAAGIQGVISFNSRDRYLDPNQVVYGSGSYSFGENLKFGFSVSWRQWSELLEDIERGLRPEVRCKVGIEQFQDKFETVFSWIPGIEPDKKGVVFTAHLFEGYTKRGANDNMSGVVIQLEILRALSKLIARGDLPQPLRNIYFIWPNEISGTYESIKNIPGFVDKLSININMDMCGEALRLNNSHFTMSECPNHLPSYLDGLAKSIMNYVWRTNDIVYLPDSPGDRPGGQYFPIPMVEKNGSTDAFRFFIHQATGGSDHVCFNNASVRVPAIEFFTWPDQWYHADTDTPDKSDPTQMKRVAFIGAACAWAAANCTDDVLPGLVDVTSEFGYSRIAEREHPRALDMIEKSVPDELEVKTHLALNMMDFAVSREIKAIKSVEEIYSGSESAKTVVNNRVEQWELYREGISSQIMEYAELKASQMRIRNPGKPVLSTKEKDYDKIIPVIHPDVMGKQFNFGSNIKYQQLIDQNPRAFRDIGFNRTAEGLILNHIDGENSLTKIKKAMEAELREEVDLDKLVTYFEYLKTIDWIIIK
ncbi:M28 family peptidase, partial [candidate division KSB1 bacterium]